jgi:hypothetical protein
MPYFIHQRLAKASAVVSLSMAAVLSGLPAQAATFAGSLGDFSFGNFSRAPLSTDSSVRTSTVTTGEGADAVANADAQFNTLPRSEAFNSLDNTAFTTGLVGSAQSESEATVIGNFLVNAGETFTFDFSGFLDLFTVTEQPTEFAAAALATQYSIITPDITSDSSTELDFFSLVGQISTPDGADDFNVANSDAITLLSLDISDDIGANKTSESLSIDVSGRYERFFAQTTAFTLVEFKQGEAFGESEPVPESSSPVVWLLGMGGAIALIHRRTVALSSVS